MDVVVEALLASPASRYEGRPSDGPLPAPDGERHDALEVRAGHGVVGDRYAGAAAHRRAAVTLIAAEAVEAVAAELGTGPLDPRATRRNVVLRGVDVDALRGRTIVLDTGGGQVRLHAHRPASPCGWMDVVLAPGAHRALRGRGGVRCEPLSDGVLHLGPGTLRVEPGPT